VTIADGAKVCYYALAGNAPASSKQNGVSMFPSQSNAVPLSLLPDLVSILERLFTSEIATRSAFRILHREVVVSRFSDCSVMAVRTGNTVIAMLSVPLNAPEDLVTLAVYDLAVNVWEWEEEVTE
jgi:hypothetical protein